MDKAQIEIGWSFDTRKGMFNSVVSCLNDIEGIEVSDRQIGQLAGPNNLLQFVTAHWEAFLTAGSMFFGQLLKNAADDIWKNKAKFVDLIRGQSTALLRPFVSAVGAGRSFGTVVTAAIPAKHKDRNAAIELVSADPNDIAWVLTQLARQGPKIQAAIARLTEDQIHPAVFNENPDCSIKLTLNDNGYFELTYRAYDEPTKTYMNRTKVFPSDGD